MLFTVKIPDFPLHNNEYEDQLGFNDMNESDIKNEQEHQEKNMTDGELNDIFEEGIGIGIDHVGYIKVQDMAGPVPQE